jgi:signal peptidase I
MDGNSRARARNRQIRRAGRIASGAAVAVAALAVLLVLAPAVFGWQRYAIVSGSMSGTYGKGSLVLDEVVPVADLEVGDVITYTPPTGDHLITHRIASISRGPGGARIFRTKGDANPVADPWTFTLDRPEQARVRIGVPFAGYALTALADRQVRMLLIAFPAVLIAFFNLAGLWRRLGTLETAT